MSMLAAVTYPKGFPIDAFMAGLPEPLKALGLGLAGVVQHNEGACAAGCLSMTLEDLATGRRFPISENRGAGSSGCRLDATGLAAAGFAITTALGGRVDLVLVNKFGRQEMLGQGLRDEIAAALLAEVPVLIAVREDLLPAWRDFAGDDWTALPAQSGEVLAWATRCRRLAA